MSYSSNCNTANSCEMEIEEQFESFLSMFSIQQKLGEGAFARVLLGLHSLDGQKFAIKQALAKEYDEELAKEARILGSLDHPFINKLYYFNDQMFTNQLSCMVIDLEENGDLLDNVMRFGRFPEAIVRRIVIQMLDALEYVHLKGIAHNDIKCENFVFDKDFNIKLIDFGLATQSRFVSSQILGTLGYQAPEIVRRQLPYDAFKADIFALGIVFFTMYIGKFPFREANPKLSNYKLFIINNEKFWEKHEKAHKNLKISSGFKELINGMLDVNSFERYDFQKIKKNAWINEPFATKFEVQCHCSKQDRK